MLNSVILLDRQVYKALTLHILYKTIGDENFNPMLLYLEG